MNLEIAIHNHNYEKRLCWMLSSTLKQQGDVPSEAFEINVFEYCNRRE